MATGNGPRQLRCDCAEVFDNVPSLAQHIKQTGHMKAKWCASCSRLFTRKEKLEEHKRTAAVHKNNQGIPKKPDTPLQKGKSNTSASKATVSSKRPAAASKKPTGAAEVFVAAADKSETAVKTSKVSEDPNGKEKVQEKVRMTPAKGAAKSGKAVRNRPAPSVAALAQPAMVAKVEISTKYPWASKAEGPKLLATLKGCCHDQNCLRYQGYHVGDFTSPQSIKSGSATFMPTPVSIGGKPRRKAIAIDCEMVAVEGGKNELALLCAVDLFSGEVLIESLVLPTEHVKDWRSRYSGITPSMMNAARVSGKALNGWPAARAKLFEFADADTILVGHSLNNDLKVLHIYHMQIVDSCILVAEAVFGKGKMMERKWGLKTLSRELLGVRIQSSKKGHDCLEDTLASRELVLWCLKQPEQLEAWAGKALVQYKIKKEERIERQIARALEKAKELKRGQEALGVEILDERDIIDY
ncbi:ribonuclease H-like protein [Hypoxylon sp. FL1150]|nr:ribonuclease H-like protein [Hypoxylon sp. FL1150]